MGRQTACGRPVVGKYPADLGAPTSTELALSRLGTSPGWLTGLWQPQGRRSLHGSSMVERR
jgi:hypothetical protein